MISTDSSSIDSRSSADGHRAQGRPDPKEETMDAIALLIADHNRVRGLFAQFEDAKEAENVETMASVGATIATELDVHTRIEEEIFYPWAKGLDEEIVEMIDEGYEEHHVVKGLLHEIAGLEPGDDQWVAKLTVVIENVEHHAEE